MDNIEVRIEILDGIMPGTIPKYATSGSSGLDLRANANATIARGRWALIPCGFRIQIPDGYEGQIRPRSGLAWKFGLTILNTPGTIDSDYRGEVKVIMMNLSQEDFEINRLDRIAQLVICPVIKATLIVVDDLDETERGSGGLGSTGVS